MYKRPVSRNGFQYKEPKTKMRKLDISVCAGNQPSSSTGITNAQLVQPSTSNFVPAPNHNVIGVTSSINSNNKIVESTNHQRNIPPTNDLWGDDSDDELIIIASQAVDNMEILSQKIVIQSMDLSQNNASKKIKNEADLKMFKDILNGTQDEDRLFSELQNFDNIGNNNEAMNEYLENNENSLMNPKTPKIGHNQPQGSQSVFKVPTQIINDNKRGNPIIANRNDVNMSFNPQSRPQSTQFTQRLEIPPPNMRSAPKVESKDVQVKYLTQQQSELRKQYQYIQDENQRLTDLCQIKDGASSLLRCENERLQNLFENVRKEKSNEISKVKIDHAAKMSELEKEILSLKSLLQFQEISTKQQQNRKNNSQLIQSSMNSNLDVHPWMKFQLLKKIRLPPSNPKPIDFRIFISSNIRSDISTFDKKQLNYLNDIQRILADMVNQKHFTNNGRSKMFDEILRLAILSAVDMHKYALVDEIKSKKNEFSLTYDDISDMKVYRINSEQKLFRNEEAFLSRRILICLSTICDQFPEFSPTLLNYHDANDAKNGNFLQILSRTLETICYSRHISNFQGFVESSCVFLTSFAENCDIDNPESLSTTASVLHNILLCRPGVRSLEIVSKFLELTSYRCQNNNFFDYLCSNRQTQFIVEPLAIIKYKSDTCTLQIYALLIRLSILPHMEKKYNTKQLTAITKSSLIVVQNSFLKSSKWMSAENCVNCLCRGRIFGAVVTLLYVSFLHWIERPNEIDFQTISKLAELGVEFFYENLVKNYESSILTTDGPIIRNRIRIIVDWLNFYDFRFKLPHQSALQSICLHRLEPMVEYLRYGKNITNNFVVESCEVYNNVVDKFFVDH